MTYLLEQVFRECSGGMCRMAVIFNYGFLELLGVENGDAQILRKLQKKHFRIPLHIQKLRKVL